MAALPPASALLAVVLEIECARGRDPNKFVEKLSSALSSNGGKALTGSILPQDAGRGQRAVDGLLGTLNGPKAAAQASDTALTRLQRGLGKMCRKMLSCCPQVKH